MLFLIQWLNYAFWIYYTLHHWQRFGLNNLIFKMRCLVFLVTKKERAFHYQCSQCLPQFLFIFITSAILCFWVKNSWVSLIETTSSRLDKEPHHIVMVMRMFKLGRHQGLGAHYSTWNGRGLLDFFIRLWKCPLGWHRHKADPAHTTLNNKPQCGIGSESFLLSETQIIWQRHLPKENWTLYQAGKSRCVIYWCLACLPGALTPP